MVSSFSIFTVVLGAAVARIADRVAINRETMETVAGLLLLGGFAAIGCALPMI
jgi:hypothetical protein